MSRSGPKASRATRTYGSKSPGRPRLPVGLGHHPRQLAVDVREAGRRLEVLAPAVHPALLDQGLGQVVDHHGQVGQLPGEGRDVAQVSRAEEQVEGDTVPLEDPKAPQDVVTNDPVVVRLVVGDVPDADEPGVAPQLGELVLAGLAGEIHPAHHAGQEVVALGEAQHPAALLDVVLGLDEDRPVHSRRPRGAARGRRGGSCAAAAPALGRPSRGSRSARGPRSAGGCRSPATSRRPLSSPVGRPPHASSTIALMSPPSRRAKAGKTSIRSSKAARWLIHPPPSI